MIPVGEWMQELRVYSRTPEGIEAESVVPVAFVPMTGEVRERRR